MLRKKTKNKTAIRRSQDQQRKQPLGQEKKPFIEHVRELRTRVMYIALAVALFGGLAAFFQKQLTEIILHPAGKQQFIFTNPGGGFDFVFQLCLAAGVFAAIPVIIYQALRYLLPIARSTTAHFLSLVAFWSGILAIIGICFGYFVALPSGLRFLLTGFNTSTQISALINIQSYFSFVLIYLVGSAALFQLPLILLAVNKVTRLKPSKLLGQQRWVVLLAFIAGAVISPTTDVRNQAILSVPIIIMYNLGVVLVWLANRHKTRSKKVNRLLESDSKQREKRLQSFAEAQKLWVLEEPEPTPSLLSMDTGSAETNYYAVPATEPKKRMVSKLEQQFAGKLATPLPEKPIQQPTPVKTASPVVHDIMSTPKHPSPVAKQVKTLPPRPSKYLEGFDRSRYRSFSPGYH